MNRTKPFQYRPLAMFVLAAVAGLFSACATGEPATLDPPPAATAQTSVVAAPTPVETRDPYLTFEQNLKTAIEQNDDDSLKSMVTTPWYTGRYKSELTEYLVAADVVSAFRAMRQRAAVTLDLGLAGTPPPGAPNLGELIIVAHWMESSGADEAAFLYIKNIGGGWRWAGLLVGVPQGQVAAQPTATPAVLAPGGGTPPATATAVAPGLPGRLVYALHGAMIARRLAGNLETTVSDHGGSTQWDWSRDGTRAVFVAAAPANSSEIWSVNVDGSSLTRLADSGRYANPRWSPDGTRILYGSTVAGGTAGNADRAEIWVMNADGGNKHKLANGFDASWSPDGQRIAFASNPISQGTHNGIHLMNALGSHEWSAITTDTTSPKFTALAWQMSQGRLVDSPQWSPDGKELTLRVSGGHGAYVTTDAFAGGFGKFIAVFFDSAASGFSYSPDGVYIAVGAGGQSGYATIAIYRRSEITRDGVSGAPLRTLGNVPKQVGESGQSVLAYDWSPDGTRVAYALDKGGVWIMDIASGAATQLDPDGAGPLFWLQ